MGRGAGNLKMELLLTALNAKTGLQLNFNALAQVVDGFEKLQQHHQWGTNLPYMVSGANSLPQKDVMEWVTKRFYSINSIIRALQNQKDKVQDNQKLSTFEADKKYKKAIIIGGGPQAAQHAEAINQFINTQKDICLIHASSKNAGFYKDIPASQFFCLVGSEGHRLEKVFEDMGDFKGTCLLPPFPRKMGTYIPASLQGRSFELPKIEFTSRLTDSHTVLALQAALDLGAKEVYMVGYDGYQEGLISQLEKSLSDENESLFQDFHTYGKAKLCSLTTTNYNQLPIHSVYGFLV